MAKANKLGLRKRLALNLYSGIRADLEKEHPLREIFWECTLRCNLNCVHCGSDCRSSSATPDMPAEDFLRAIDQVTPHVDPHLVMIVITGGEALCRKDLESVGRELYKRGYPWGLVTNGMLLTRERMRSLVAAGMRSITLSIDGFEEQHNAIRRHPQSWRNAERALEVMTTTSLYDEWERVRPQSQLDLALKNRLGTRAADFRYMTKEGRWGSLYGIRARYTLLFINNPGCPACKDTREQISASPMLTQLIDEGVIRVLAVYPDEDLKEWYDYQPNMPANWINSYDKELAMREKELYDLRAIPTLYLLDQDKNVLLKDCMSIPTIEQVIYYRDYNKQQ